MKKLNATEFKAKCLKLLENLDPEGLIITKRGKPLARVLPIRPKSLNFLYGCMKQKIKITGDVMSTGIRWDAES